MRTSKLRRRPACAYHHEGGKSPEAAPLTLANAVFRGQTFDPVASSIVKNVPLRSGSDGAPRSIRSLGFCAVVLLAALLSGCAPTALSSARHQIAEGQYAAAHRELAAIQMSTLSLSERREVKDDLCLSEFMIGEPGYSFGEQRRVCTEAALEPGSQSAQFIDKLDTNTRNSAYARVEAALAKGNLAGAEQAALVYVNTAGADPAVVDKWSHRMWELVEKRDRRAGHRRKKELANAIGAVSKQYPSMRKMSKEQFANWVAKEGNVEGASMFSSIALMDQEVTLSVKKSDLHEAALKLDRIANINDATVARCGCDGRTNVGVAETNFPLYLVRLDPETKRSEVLILPHRQ
jgi:hypothetical protein